MQLDSDASLVPLAHAAFSPAAFRARAMARLASSAEAELNLGFAGDHTLNPDLLPPPRLKAAAVLVPVVSREPEATILLTRRTDHLTSHAGQIAFPGGKIDPGDDGPRGAAIREAVEEIGLGQNYLDVLGFADVYVSNSGYRIQPVVAMVDPAFAPHPNPDEVAAVFEAPLSFLMNPANHARASRMFQGAERHYYEMPFGEHRIWGVTAGILRRLYERIYGG